MTTLQNAKMPSLKDKIEAKKPKETVTDKIIKKLKGKKNEK